MPAPAISPTVRAILSTNIDLPADEVIRKAKDRGVIAPESSIRYTVHNIRSALKKQAKKGKTAAAPAVAPAAARETKAPKPAPASAPISTASTSELSSVLSNVALVNTVVGVSGGVDAARQVAEAVRECGGVEEFLQHLELVAKVRGGTSA